MLELVSKSADDTRQIGEQLGRYLRGGDFIVLDGPLGAGKTTFVQGVSQSLDVKGRVTSPTFIVARVHGARNQGPDLVHVDAYRLEGVDDLESVGLDESLADSITFVEWGRGKVEALSAERLEIEFREAAGDESRTIRLVACGPQWGARLGEMAGDFAEFTAANPRNPHPRKSRQ